MSTIEAIKLYTFVFAKLAKRAVFIYNWPSVLSKCADCAEVVQLVVVVCFASNEIIRSSNCP